MKNWLKKHFSDPKAFVDASPGKELKKQLSKPELWKINCFSVSRGVAVGLFVAMIPILPFQSLLTVILAILIRANLPIAFLVSWVSNPLTILPLAYFTYFVGNWILGENQIPTSDLHHFSWSFSQYGKGFFVGLPIVAFAAALIGYLIVRIFWRLAVKFQKK